MMGILGRWAVRLSLFMDDWIYNWAAGAELVVDFGNEDKGG